ncbi:MAG: M3 family oligoendopeptidase [Chloroflexi bacterium]|nr:M3 family oligoendopeptidase [Chloroflexota bacterium]MBV9893248.1 M3 family oligoendopeptidase [Chloroflexota bacterium]
MSQTTSSAASVLADEETWARRALPRASRAWWTASLSGRRVDYQRMEAADRAVNRHYSRPTVLRRLERLLQASDLDGLTRRRLERLCLAYRAKQAPIDILDRITSAEADIQETYSTFRATFDGHAASDNELEDVLRISTDSARVEAAWLARKQIGSVVSDDLRQLAHLRNEAARAIGFKDYWHAQLQLDELDPAALIETLDAVERATQKPFKAMKADLDRQLARRFKVAQRDLRPWHYADPFFQETPEVFAPPADPLYADRDVVELAADSYRQLGFRNIDAILARSDLYPRKGKNQHAYAVDIDREGDVRTFLNVERNARWMNTLLHELGHTIYQDGIDRTELPYDLRDDPQGFLNEGFAMFCEQPTANPAWLREMLGRPREQADALGPQLAAQDAASLLAFVRWCLTIVHFERHFYADPDRDLNQLWWDLEERYQLVPRPEGRNEPDWAAKVHVATAPVYYQKYLLGQLFAKQLSQRLDAEFGGWWPGRARAGAFIKNELFLPGARYPWSVLVERVTGQPLGVDALARAVAWPRPASSAPR